MLINDLVSMLMRVPPLLAGAWAAWFFVGLMLSIWQRRERARLVVHGPSTKNKSGVRPPSGMTPKTLKNSAQKSGDAFGELEAILEPTPARLHRRPGEDPMAMAATQQG